MKRTLVIAGCAIAMMLFAALPAHAIVIGAFDASRAENGELLGGPYTSESFAAVSANFPAATFATTPVLTSEFLAEVDVLLLAPVAGLRVHVEPLSVAEQAALFDFVMAGGNALLFGEFDHTVTANSYMNLFGVSVAPAAHSLIYVEPTQPNHAVLDGPFGPVPQALFYIPGKLTDLGPHAVAIAASQGTGDAEIAVIDRYQLGPNSGRIVFIADCTPFYDSNRGGLASVAEHQALLLNSIHYLAAPEPGTLALAGIGGFGLLLAACRRLLLPKWQ